MAFALINFYITNQIFISCLQQTKKKKRLRSISCMHIHQINALLQVWIEDDYLRNLFFILIKVQTKAQWGREKDDYVTTVWILVHGHLAGLKGSGWSMVCKKHPVSLGTSFTGSLTIAPPQAPHSHPHALVPFSAKISISIWMPWEKQQLLCPFCSFATLCLSSLKSERDWEKWKDREREGIGPK